MHDPQKERWDLKSKLPPKLILLENSSTQIARVSLKRWDCLLSTHALSPTSMHCHTHPTAILTWPHPAMAFAAPSPCALSDCPQFNRNRFSTPVTNTKSKELNHKNPYLDSETKVFHIWRTHQTETVTETSMHSNTIVAIMFKFKAKKKPFVLTLGFLIVSSTLRIRQAASVAALMVFMCATHKANSGIPEPQTTITTSAELCPFHWGTHNQCMLAKV